MMRMWIVTLVSFVCVGTAAAAEAQWLQDLRAREAAPGKTSEIRSPDGWFSVNVPAKLVGKVDQSDGSYSMALEMAPGILANCEVIKDGVDLAALLSQTSTSTFGKLAELQGKVSNRAIERTDAGHIAGSPYLALDWLYGVETKEGLKVGSLKQAGAIKGAHGVYCYHNDVGYSKSFETLTRAFVESLQVKDSAVPSVYEDVSVVRIGTSKIGVVSARVTRDGDDAYRVTMVSALAIPVAADTLRTQDTYSVQFALLDGAMINAKQVVASNGQLESSLDLLPLDDGGWQIKGQHMGKDIEGRLDASPKPTTFVQQALARKALLGQPNPVGAENLEWQWVTADPLRLTESRLKVVGPGGTGLFKARETVGTLQADTLIESATGLTQQADIAMGANTMIAERVYARGGL
jgi:hypothetical protein